MMEKRPPWLKVRYNEAAVREVAELMRDLKLNTVCREANCPNLGSAIKSTPPRSCCWGTSAPGTAGSAM